MLCELVKLLAISSLVLVFVMAVAAAIKPLSDGLLGPVSLIKFVGFMAPAMLSLALPFAGAFTATILFNRMVADNEVQVCRASGMNYMLILLPVILLGLAVMVVMFYLSNSLIPKCCDNAEHSLEKDVLSGMVKKVQRGESIQHGRLILYADKANEGDPPQMDIGSGVSPQRLIALEGVVVGQVDDDGRIRRNGSAQRADLLLYHAGGESWIVLKLTKPRYFGEDEHGKREWGESDKVMPLGPYLVANPFRERISFLSWDQLRDLKTRPELYRHVRSAKQRLVAEMARRDLAWLLARELTADSSDGTVTLCGSRPGEKYVIRAPVVKLSGTVLELAASQKEKVRIERFKHGLLPDRRFLAKEGTVRVLMDPAEDEEPRISIRLLDAQVFDAKDDRFASDSGVVMATGAGTERREVWRTMQQMRWPDPDGIAKPLRNRPLLELLPTVRARYEQVPEIKRIAARATSKVRRLMYLSLSQIHERASLAVGCLLTVVLGAVLSIKLRGSMPLVVYFWTFVLAAAAVIVTRSGDQLIGATHLPFAVGVAVTWAGNLLVVAAILASYWRLEKN